MALRRAIEIKSFAWNSPNKVTFAGSAATEYETKKSFFVDIQHLAFKVKHNLPLLLV